MRSIVCGKLCTAQFLWSRTEVAESFVYTHFAGAGNKRSKRVRGTLPAIYFYTSRKSFRPPFSKGGGVEGRSPRCSPLEMEMDGIIVLDKPQDFTSFDAVAVVRGLTRERRIGHTGTLDPMATGVLPLLLGRATKAVSLLPDTDKSYEASFRFGEARDTGDVTGALLNTDDTPVSLDALKAALPRFTGDILQVPPMYSAVSVNGQRLYKLARQGVEIEREARPVHVASLELLEYDENTRAGRIAVTCSKGTYIRTLIEDIAAALSTCGVMTALRRTAACGFTLADAVSLDALKALKESGDFSAVLRPVEKLFSALPAVQVTPAQGQRYLNGGALDFARCRAPRIAMPEGAQLSIYCEGRFLGLARLENGELRYVKSFSVE